MWLIRNNINFKNKCIKGKALAPKQHPFQSLAGSKWGKDKETIVTTYKNINRNNFGHHN